MLEIYSSTMPSDHGFIVLEGNKPVLLLKCKSEIDTLIIGKMLLRRKKYKIKCRRYASDTKAVQCLPIVALLYCKIFFLCEIVLQDIPMLLRPHKAALLQCISRSLILLANCYVHCTCAQQDGQIQILIKRASQCILQTILTWDKIQFNTSIREGCTQVT